MSEKSRGRNDFRSVVTIVPIVKVTAIIETVLRLLIDYELEIPEGRWDSPAGFRVQFVEVSLILDTDSRGWDVFMKIFLVAKQGAWIDTRIFAFIADLTFVSGAVARTFTVRITSDTEEPSVLTVFSCAS